MPKKLSFVTLGARNLAQLRRFYTTWGWPELPDSTDEWAGFDAGGTRLALYPISRLRDEAAPADPLPDQPWNGITLAINVTHRDLVQVAYQAAIDAGANPVAEPQPRDWGGHSAYIADPEGNHWEIAWAPNLDDRLLSK